MSSADEASLEPSQVEISEFETQFIPQSDDDEQLWEVVAITAERGKRYKVKWAGNDPKTGKPWAQSWVDKHDCTDDLVSEWKLKQKKKKEEALKKQPKGASTTTKPNTSRLSKASSKSVSRRTRSSTATGSGEVIQISISGSDSEPPRPGPSKLTKGEPRTRTSKRKRVSSSPSIEFIKEDDSNSTFKERPQKKQKVNVEVVVLPWTNRNETNLEKNPTNSGNKALIEETDSRDGAGDIREHIDVDAIGSKVDKIGPPRGVKQASKSRREPGTTLISAAAPSSRGSSRPSSRVKAFKSASTSFPSKTKGKGRVKLNSDLVMSGSSDVSSNDGSGSRQKGKLNHKSHLPDISENIPSAQIDISDHALQDYPDDPDPSTTTPPFRPRTPVLSPRALARLELFDRMVLNSDPNESTVEPIGQLDFVYNNEVNAPELPVPQPSEVVPQSNFEGAYDSPRSGIVPETETQSSTDHSQAQPAIASSVKEPVLPLVARGHKSVPIIRQTSPHLARSSDSNSRPLNGKETVPTSTSIPLPVIAAATSLDATLAASKKPLHRIPQISPSTFRAHLPPPKPRADEIEHEPPMSSIESFDSPKRTLGKRRIRNIIQSPTSESNETRSNRAAGISDFGLRTRGQELYHQHEKRQKESLRDRHQTQKKDLFEVVRAGADPKGKAKAKGRVLNADNAPEAKYSHVGMNSTTGTSRTEDTDDSRNPPNLENLRVLLREEEEESTQDALGMPLQVPELIVNGRNVFPEEEGENTRDVQLEMQGLLLGTEANERGAVAEEEENSQDLQLEMQSFLLGATDNQPITVGEKEDTRDPKPKKQPLPSDPKANERDISDDEELHDLALEIQQYLTQESASGNNNVQDQTDHQNVAVDAGIQATEDPLQPTRVHDTAPRQRTTADDGISMIEQDSQQVSLMVQPTQGERLELSSGPEKSFFAAFGSPAVGDLPFTRSQTEPPTRNLAEALNLLNVKSEEIERLERALAQERSKLTKLQGEVGTLKSKNTTMADSIMQTEEHQEQSLSESMDLTSARAEWDLEKSTWAKERSMWEMERAGWDTIRAVWDAEREKLKSEHTELTTSVATLTSSADSLNDARASAEKDRDFFREQYSQASGYVSSVRAENAELERRATIAEGQARDGVAMYKGLFETQIKTLKGDVSRWKGIAELLQEKDQRTNDEIRRRAGEEPELREQCERLQGHLEAFEGAYRRLSGAHRQGKLARHKLDKKLMRLRKEKAVLQIRLENMGNAIKKGLARSLEEDFTTMADASLREDEDEDMYTCMWRIDGGVEQCPESFDCIKDMEGHMVLAGHIQGRSE